MLFVFVLFVFVSRCSFVFFFFCLFSCLFWVTILYFLLCILFSCCCRLFVFVALVFCQFLNLGYQNISQKFGKSEIPKWKMQQKKQTFGQEQLAQVCSQIVCFVSWKFAWFAENTIAIVVSTRKQKQKWHIFKVKNWSKSNLKIGPSMLRNKLGPVFYIVNFVFCCCFCSFCQKYSPLCRENKSFKNKKQRTLGPIAISRRANIGPALTLQRMYIYIYIYCFLF